MTQCVFGFAYVKLCNGELRAAAGAAGLYAGQGQRLSVPEQSLMVHRLLSEDGEVINFRTEGSLPIPNTDM